MELATSCDRKVNAAHARVVVCDSHRWNAVPRVPFGRRSCCARTLCTSPGARRCPKSRSAKTAVHSEPAIIQFIEMRDTIDHPTAAAEFIADRERVRWHDGAVWSARVRRDKASHELVEWETLREVASQIKLHTMSRLDEYLEEFEKNATRLGATVWRRFAPTACPGFTIGQLI